MNRAQKSKSAANKRRNEKKKQKRAAEREQKDAEAAQMALDNPKLVDNAAVVIETESPASPSGDIADQDEYVGEFTKSPANPEAEKGEENEDDEVDETFHTGLENLSIGEGDTMDEIMAEHDQESSSDEPDEVNHSVSYPQASPLPPHPVSSPPTYPAHSVTSPSPQPSHPVSSPSANFPAAAPQSAPSKPFTSTSPVPYPPRRQLPQTVYNATLADVNDQIFGLHYALNSARAELRGRDAEYARRTQGLARERDRLREVNDRFVLASLRIKEEREKEGREREELKKVNERFRRENETWKGMASSVFETHELQHKAVERMRRQFEKAGLSLKRGRRKSDPEAIL